MQYKCNDCNHKFSSEEDYPECPNADCRSNNVQLIRNSFSAKKVVIGIVAIIVALLAIILIIKSCSPPDTKISANQFDETNGSIIVEIKGEHQFEFEIDLIRDEDGVSMGKSAANIGKFAQKDAKSRKKTYDNLASTEKDISYTLKVIYKGENNDQSKYNFTKQFSFPKIEAVCQPSINNIDLNPTILTNSSQKYAVTVHIASTCKDKMEYSIDGTKWQSSNVFQNIPGNNQKVYTFYVRNTNDPTLTDQKDRLLPEYKKIPIPTDAELTNLLSQIAHKNQTALDKFIELVSNAKVKGVKNINDGTALANEVYIQQQPFQVINVDVQNGVLVSITVK